MIPLARTLVPLALLALAASGCTTSATAATTPTVVATTTQLGSIVGDIATCTGSTSATLMGPGDDPHDFSVSSREVATMARAKLVVSNGLGLEAGLASTLGNLASDGARILEVAPLLDPLSYAEIEDAAASDHDGHDHEHPTPDDGHGHDADGYDPHVHLDASRMATAARLIGAELTVATGDARFADCGVQVETALRATDDEVRRILTAVPEDRRVLVTDHEAYNYFAAAYGFEVAGVVIPGGSTDAEPSSTELAALVEVIRTDGVRAVFSNNTVNPRLVDAVARESGTTIQVVQLYEGSVGPQGSGAETYAGMMTTNARLIADALGA